MTVATHAAAIGTTNTADLTIRVSQAGPESAAEWNQFVRSCEHATGYHLWEWQHVLSQGLGHPACYLIARRADCVAGVLPLVEVRSLLFGKTLSSLPYVNYGGVLATSVQAERALLDAAAASSAKRGLPRLLLRHRRRVFPDLPVREHKVTMLLPLQADKDKMWAGLDRKVRNQVRKAEKSSLTIVKGGEELLDEFYAVFARNMRDLGTPVYGRGLFASVLRYFPADATLYLTKLDGQTIAGALAYAYGDSVEVPSASSLREFRNLCPNHLLYWSMITDAIADGRTVFDFGRSTPDDGTYQFKEQWGAAPEQLYWEYHLEAGEQLPTDDRHNRKFQATIEAWKRLPLSVATAIGPTIARLVP